jgi:RNA polymerase sigma-70 factor, ECF subfamily
MAPPPPPADPELVDACLRGDRRAFASLAARYYGPVTGFLFKRLQSADLAEDLAQETFLEAFRSLREGRRPDFFSSWLFGIAHNVCGKYLRRTRPRLFAPDDPPVDVAVPPELSAREDFEEQQKLLAALDAGLADLPDDTRRLLELKHAHGLTCAQIASEVGRPVGTVKSLLARTYKALRQRLRPAGEDNP